MFSSERGGWLLGSGGYSPYVASLSGGERGALSLVLQNEKKNM